MFRTLPPTAAPIPFRDLLSGVFSALSNNGTESNLKNQIQEYFKVKHVFLISSGKAALYLALKAMEETSNRREVIIPAYSSFCLASAVARTGLPIELCDIDPDTLDFDLSKLKSLITENTLAVIPVHNYGLVCDMDEIQRLALEKGAYVVEDAAQAAGALYKDRKVGAIGDIGILSLGRGKNVCSLGGGVILSENDQISDLIKRELDKCEDGSAFFSISAFLTGLSLSLFLSPERYVLPSSLPFLNLGANIFDPGFKVRRIPDLNAGVGRKTFLQIDRHNEIRIHNSRLLTDSLGKNNLFRIPKPHVESRSVYLRFPIIFTEKEKRNHVYVRLNQCGLGVTTSYPTPLNQINHFKKYLNGEGDFPGARFVADRILTLPTHPYVTEDDIQKITSVINEIT